MDPKLTIECTAAAQISFALQQNYIPVIRTLRVCSHADTLLEHITVRLRFDPEFAAPFETTLAALRPGEQVEISPVRIALSPEYLLSLTEELAASMTIEASIGEEVLCSETRSIDLLAYDQWTGTAVMPEMTAAFITPNHPKIEEILRKASVFLNEWTGDPSFTGYQTRDPNTVKKQLAAIYAALQAENIAYTVPPASYGQPAQRIRMPHTVLEQKTGTCLDLSLLYAACAEAAGLNPLVVFVKGHAFAGCWLEEETFSDCVVDDPAALTKRIATGIDTICLVECTDFVAGRSVDFDHAGQHAADALQDNFELVLDVLRCRGSGIRPVPVRISGEEGFSAVDYGARKDAEITGDPSEIDLSRRGIHAEPQKELTRQEIWERKLLDLSLRNSLLNFRPGSANLQFMATDLDKLEDEISRGEDFKVMASPSELHLTISDSKIYETENEKDMIASIAEAEFKSRRLRTFVNETELERILKKLHRSAKLSLEENGANTLYLALGFLRWYETEKSTKPRYAPLILVPVDLVRKITDKSYSLRIRGEDIQMNITLLELLRQDFGIHIGGLNPPPEDESGVDLRLVFNTVRQAVLSKNRWDIEELAFLGQFSFSQFIMWNDIRNRSEELRQNKVVASLISGKLEWEPHLLDDSGEDSTEDREKLDIYHRHEKRLAIDLSPAELDEKVSPSDMAVPIAADTSQLAAVYAASQGESFVLHGPPGTGKSQTITNMIANALYQGKSVLFVAEKMAALSVVQKRLAKIGLDPFCLELHSNKAQKRAVLNQLEQTLAIGHVKSPENYQSAADDLKARREDLNAVMTALHEELPVGMSLYQAIAQYESLREYDGIITLDADYPEITDRAGYQNALDTISRVRAAGRELGGFAASPLKAYGRTDYTIEVRDAFRKAAEQLRLTAPAAKAPYHALCDALGYAGADDLGSYRAAMDTLTAARSGGFLPDALTGATPLTDRAQEIDELLAAGRKLQAVKAEIDAVFEQTIYTVDVNAALLDWKRNEQKWFLAKSLGRKKLVKEMQLHAKNAASVTADNYVIHLGKLSEYRTLQPSVTNADAALTGVFGALWKGEQTDFDRLDAVRQATLTMRSQLAAGDTGLVGAVQKLTGNADALGKLDAAQAARDRAEAAVQALQETFSTGFDEIFAASDWFTAAADAAAGWIAGSDLLRERSVLESLLVQMESAHLGGAVSAFRSGMVNEDTLADAFACAAARSTISCAMAKHPALSHFQGTQFEVSLEQYRKAADDFAALTVQELVSRLSARIPSASEGMRGSSEISILQRAIKSGGRMLSIRKLFDSIPTLLRRICPCMLMSPISVAQYIDPAFPKFDLVIFDEASQLPTSEAVGAIARGDNVVVVGDPKQLPPTSFFTAQHTDEENYDKEDLESVLDDCLALSMPSKHLLWHYRSRHESLIAFSNVRFYENKLLTFPSPDDQVRKVTRVAVEGVYDKSKTRQNRAEAEAVVAELVRRISDEKLRQDSVGVVTFSVVQQNLIDDLLTEEFVKNPQLETWANEMYEPIFIKNLENVQGDERDVILFSVGYGPDQNGQVSMNFGPLNQDGGWRRLNVAVSRARKEMTVYSVIRPDQIDLSRTRAEGVVQLRGFLEFAERGTQALARSANAAVYENDAFAELLAAELSKLGYTVKCGVGCSGFRVDAAIVHPERPGEYILGLMLGSSNNWHTSTARDRIISQPSVLRGLGWHICNVHILDWLDNPERVLAQIQSAVNAALTGSDTPAAEPSARPRTYNAADFEKEEETDPMQQVTVYERCILPDSGAAEDFTLPRSLRSRMSAVRKVIDAEAPVSRRTLMKRIYAAWGITRTTPKYEQAFDDAVRRCELMQTESNGMTFFWKEGQNPAEYAACRTASGSEKRPMDDIPAEEILFAMRLILQAQLRLSRADLIRETARLFGFARTSAVIEAAAEDAIRQGISAGSLHADADMVSLPE